jgi:hypothetical protein
VTPSVAGIPIEACLQVDQRLVTTARSTLPANLDVDLFVQADRASGSGVSVLL